MKRNLSHIVFLSLTLTGYVWIVSRGVVLGGPSETRQLPATASAAGGHAQGYRHVPHFWATGYHGGK